MAASDYILTIRRKIGHDLLQMPCVSALITDGETVLIQRRADSGQWDLPGGAIDPGESPAQSLVREAREETGLTVRPVAVLGVIGGIRHVYPNGDAIDAVTIVFRCSIEGGELRCCDGEASELRFCAPSALPKLMIDYPREFFTLREQPTYFRWREEWLRDA